MTANPQARSTICYVELSLRFMVKPNNLRKVSIARLKQEMQDTVFLSDDLAITTIDYLRNPTSEIPV